VNIILNRRGSSPYWPHIWITNIKTEEDKKIENVVPTDIQEYVKGQIKLLVEGTRIEKITDRLQRENANELSKQLKMGRIDMGAKHKELKAPHLKRGQDVDAYFKKPVEQIKAVETNLNRVMWDFDEITQARIRVERDAAEREATRERERLARIEEKKRREQEEALEKARKAEVEAAKAKSAKERARLEAEAEAEKIKANRAFELANKSAAKADDVEVKDFPSQYVKPKGVTGKKVYRGDFYDKKAFIEWCVSNGKFHWLLVDEKSVNKSIEAEGNNWKAPGVRVIEDTKIQFRTGRRSAEKTD